MAFDGEVGTYTGDGGAGAKSISLTDATLNPTLAIYFGNTKTGQGDDFRFCFGAAANGNSGSIEQFLLHSAAQDSLTSGTHRTFTGYQTTNSYQTRGDNPASGITSQFDTTALSTGTIGINVDTAFSTRLQYAAINSPTEIINTAVETGTGNKVYNVARHTGKTVKGIIACVVNQTATGDNTGTDSGISIGFTDGTTSGCATSFVDADRPTVTWSASTDSVLINVINSSGTIVCQASIVSMGTGTFTLNYSVAATAWLVSFIVIFDDIVEVEKITQKTDGTGTVSMGFSATPEMLFGIGGGKAAGAASTTARFMFGSARSTSERASIAASSGNGVSTTADGVQTYTNRFLAICGNDGATICAADLSDMNTLNWLTADATGRVFYVMGIRSASNNAEDTVTIEGTGSVSVSGTKKTSGSASASASADASVTARKAATGTLSAEASSSVTPSTRKNARTSFTVDATGEVTASAGNTFSISSTGDVAVTGRKGARIAAAVSGTGDVSVTGKKGAQVTAAVNGTGDASVSGRKAVTGSLSVTADDTESVTQRKGARGSFSVTGTGDVQASAGNVFAISATGEVSVTGRKAASGTNSATASSDVTATGVKGARVQATITSVGTASFSVTKGARSSVSVSGTGDLDIDGGRSITGSFSVTGTAAATISGRKNGLGNVTITGATSVAISGRKGGRVDVVISGVGNVTALGRKAGQATVSITGLGQADCTLRTGRFTIVLITSTGTVTVSGFAGTPAVVVKTIDLTGRMGTISLAGHKSTDDDLVGYKSEINLRGNV